MESATTGFRVVSCCHNSRVIGDPLLRKSSLDIFFIPRERLLFSYLENSITDSVPEGILYFGGEVIAIGLLQSKAGHLHNPRSLDRSRLLPVTVQYLCLTPLYSLPFSIPTLRSLLWRECAPLIVVVRVVSEVEPA